VVSAIGKVLPHTKFIGLGLATEHPEWFEYFLNPANHKAGIPLDYISYHTYAGANEKQTFDAYDYATFDRAENFINTVSFIESIRKRLSPNTKTDIDELGALVSDQMRNQPINPAFYNLSASIYAYFYIELSKQGIDVIGESQLVGFPTQFPDVTMINYLDNKPNARFWVLKLILDNIKKGSKLIGTDIIDNSGDDLLAQGFITPENKKMVLILNKRNRGCNIKLPAGFAGAKMSTVDAASGDAEAVQADVKDETIPMAPFAVKLIVLK
jgi:hypothetical protein